MTANSAGYHESEDKLRSETQDNHLALTSMQEELEAAERVNAATVIHHVLHGLRSDRRHSPPFAIGADTDGAFA